MLDGSLSAFFGLSVSKAASLSPAAPKPKKAGGGGQGRNGRAVRGGPPRPADVGAGVGLHASFEPLPPEKNVPRAAEQPGQAWHALHDGVTRDDNIAEFKADADADVFDEFGDDFDESPRAGDEADDESEPDFEPESLDPLADDDKCSMGSSLEEDRSLHSFFTSRRQGAARGADQARALYTGPMLCLEDEDFE
jgi:hypothetical protein